MRSRFPESQTDQLRYLLGGTPEEVAARFAGRAGLQRQLDVRLHGLRPDEYLPEMVRGGSGERVAVSGKNYGVMPGRQLVYRAINTRRSTRRKPQRQPPCILCQLYLPRGPGRLASVQPVRGARGHGAYGPVQREHGAGTRGHPDERQPCAGLLSHYYNSRLSKDNPWRCGHGWTHSGSSGYTKDG